MVPTKEVSQKKILEVFRLVKKCHSEHVLGKKVNG